MRVGALAFVGQLPVRVTQRLQQVRQAIVVNLMHQSEQAPDFPLGKALPSEPGQVVARKVSNTTTLVLAIGHLQGDKPLEVLWIQRLVLE